MTGKTIDILVIEDDMGDVELTRQALADSKLALKLHFVHDGEQALLYLRQAAPYVDKPRPDLIILDLNLPRVDGREVLREVKGDRRLQAIPVCVVTTSDADADILKSYGLGANCYVTKPLGLDQFVRVIRAIEGFWLTIVKLPAVPNGGLPASAEAEDLSRPRPPPRAGPSASPPPA